MSISDLDIEQLCNKSYMKSRGVSVNILGYVIIKAPNPINYPSSIGSYGIPILTLTITGDDVIVDMTGIRSGNKAIRVFSHVAQSWLAEWRFY